MKLFTSQFLQTNLFRLGLGWNVPRDAPFTLNEQLATSSVEQFWVKFMARSTSVSKWVTWIHGLSKAKIDAKDGDPNYISVLMLVEEANSEYTMLMATDCWGPKGKPDGDGAPEGLYTKLNSRLWYRIKSQLPSNITLPIII